MRARLYRYPLALVMFMSASASLQAHAVSAKAGRSLTAGQAGAPPKGYGAGTTGGDNAPITYFSDLSSLKACLAQAAPANCVASPTSVFRVYPRLVIN